MRLLNTEFKFWKNRRFLKKYRKNSNRPSNETGGGRLLVTATCIVALASIATVWFTWEKSSDQIEIMQEQVDEMKRATEIGYRPFLTVEIYDDTLYIIPKMKNKNGVINIIDEKNTSLKPNLFTIESFRKFKYHNSGNSPMLIKRKISHMMSSNKWFNSLEKSDTLLIRELRNSNLDSLETDQPILPGSTYVSEWEDKRSLEMTPEYLYQKIINNDDLTVYTSVYIEYSDIKGRGYNLLQTMFEKVVNIQYTQMKINFNYANGLEIIRWDLFPEDTLQ